MAEASAALGDTGAGVKLDCSMVGSWEGYLDRDELRAARELYRSLVDKALLGVYITTVDGRFLYANRAAWQMLGYASGEELAAAGAEPLYSNPDQRQELLRRLVEEGQVLGYEVDVVTKQGAPRRLSVNATRSEDRIVGMLIDVTEQRRAEEALRESEARFRTLFERLADAVFIVAFDGTILEANPAAVTQTGYTMEELLEVNMMSRLAFQEPPVSYATIIGALKRGETVFFEEEKRRKDGTHYWTSCALSPIELAGRSLVLSVNRDITDRKRAEEKLHYLSTHDALTGAHNRAYFDEELARLSQGRRFPVTVLMADVNGLKRVNDSLGHAAGDEVLRRAYRVLRAGVRGEDVVARIGGDEFGVVLPETDEGAAVRVVARIREGLATHNTQHPDEPLSMAFGTATAHPHEPLDAALRLADARMYEDKRGSSNDSGRIRS